MNRRTAAIIAIVGAVMLGVGTLLPWATITTGFGSASVNGIEGDGVIVLAIATLIGIIAVASMDRPGRAAPLVIAVAAGLALVALFIDYAGVSERLQDASSSVARASIGTGLYLCLAGAGVALIGAIFLFPGHEEAPADGRGPSAGA